MSSWRVLTGSDAAAATSVATVPLAGFETAVHVQHPGAYVRVPTFRCRPADASGTVPATVVVG